jgi:hypothetical protein
MYREGECQLCGEEDENLDQTRQKINEYPKEESWDEEQTDAIYRYEDAQTEHQEAMRRKQAFTNYDEGGTRSIRPGYPVGGFILSQVSQFGEYPSQQTRKISSELRVRIS